MAVSIATEEHGHGFIDPTTLTPAHLKREYFKIRTLMRKASTERYVITMSVKGSYNEQTGKYDRNVWPILFPSRYAAERFASLCGWWKNSRDTSKRGRIVSCSVEKVKLRSPSR